jgi:hypothetical protein
LTARPALHGYGNNRRLTLAGPDYGNVGQCKQLRDWAM